MILLLLWIICEVFIYYNLLCYGNIILLIGKLYLRGFLKMYGLFLRFLKESLGGNFKIVMIVIISFFYYYIEEIFSIFRYFLIVNVCICLYMYICLFFCNL